MLDNELLGEVTNHIFLELFSFHKLKQNNFSNVEPWLSYALVFIRFGFQQQLKMVHTKLVCLSATYFPESSAHTKHPMRS